MTNKTNKILVPYRLDWDPSNPGQLITGRGSAGWSLAEFDDLEAARAWAKRHTYAAMPCWRRPECWGGQPLGA